VLAAELEAHGHDLMVADQYHRAVRVLERTLQATGEKSGACVEPSTQACLTYAFALYDLGRSLRLAGDPAAAVPVLEQRLRIDNQRQVVAAELAQARQQAGQRSG
jgi:tetratricopeptide (TPR) repeat protein